MEHGQSVGHPSGLSLTVLAWSLVLGCAFPCPILRAGLFCSRCGSLRLCSGMVPSGGCFPPLAAATFCSPRIFLAVFSTVLWGCVPYGPWPQHVLGLLLSLSTWLRSMLCLGPVGVIIPWLVGCASSFGPVFQTRVPFPSIFIACLPWSLCASLFCFAVSFLQPNGCSCFIHCGVLGRSVVAGPACGTVLSPDTELLDNV